MKLRMSRRLVLLNDTRRSGVVKLRSGGGADAARARSRSCWICGFGRAASTRSRIVLSRSATFTLIRRLVFAERRLELVLPFVLRRAGEVGARRGEHRALQRNLVLRVLGRLLNGLAVRHDGSVEVAVLGRHLTLLERLPGRAANGQRRHGEQESQPGQQSAVCSSQVRKSSHNPVNRIVCRPRPSRYDSSIDSVPIRRMRYWPSTVSPSLA